MTCKPWMPGAVQLRAVLLPAVQCDSCGDQVVAGFDQAPVCGRCSRLAVLRQKLARQPSMVALRRAKVGVVPSWRQRSLARKAK